MEYNEYNKAIELFEKAIQSYLDAVESADTKRDRSILILNKEHAEVEINRCTILKSINDSSKMKMAAVCECCGSSLYMKAANLARNYDDAMYFNYLGESYTDKSGYHYYLACASREINNLDDALKYYKKALELLKTAEKHYNKSLDIESDQGVKNNLEKCRKYIRMCEDEIREVTIQYVIRMMMGGSI